MRYLDFWPNFSPEDFLFTHLIKEFVGENLELITNPEVPVDLEICSVFCFESTYDKVKERTFSSINKIKFSDYVSRSTYGYRMNYQSKSSRRIWYTGENKRFPLSKQIDGGISFDLNDDGINNFYFPYWMTQLDWGFSQKPKSTKISPQELVKFRDPSLKNGKVCSFASNIDPTREKILKVLEERFQVVRFGKSVNNPVDSKFETSNQFLFQVCNENDLYPGYVTEKLQESWIAGNVPIWSGLHIDNHFNDKAYINVTNLTVSQIRDFIFGLTDNEIFAMYSEPLLNYLPTLDPLKNFIERNL